MAQFEFEGSRCKEDQHLTVHAKDAGDNRKVVWAEFSTLSLPVLVVAAW